MNAPETKVAVESQLLVTRDASGVATLTLNRPQRRNALTHRMMLELEDAFVGVGNDAACRALVLRGAGGQSR